MLAVMRWLILRRLRSSDLDTSRNAFAVATRTRDVDALLAVIDDADEYVRRYAIDALGQIGDPRAVPALIKGLDDDNFNNQEAAAAALAALDDGRAVRPLVAMLRTPDKHQQARFAASKALVALGDAKAVPDLLEALRDKDSLSRFISLQVLAVVGDGRCVPAAITALRDAESNVQWQAVETLGALRDARAVDALLDLLRRGAREHTPSREVIVEALSRIGDRRAEAALAALLHEPEKDLRDAAAAALHALGWQPADDGLRVRYDLALERWDELARLGWERARQPLAESLQKGDRGIKLQAVEAIGRLGEPSAVESLSLALSDENESVADAAAMVLGRIGDARAVKPLIDHCVRYRPTGGHRHDPHAPGREAARANAWVSPLEALRRRSATEIAPEDLRQLAGLSSETHHLRVEYDTPGYGDGADNFSVMLNLSQVRQLATRELGRRGLDG